MAKFEGDQEIPPALLDLYKATLNPTPTGKIVKTRYPFHMPKMQEDGPGVSAAQVAQRDRFKLALANFANRSGAERQKWYDNAPEWGSHLWYYNYYIMSDLAGNADWKDGGFGVIKSIQFVKDTVGVGGGKSFTIDTVDPDKTVVMIFGNSYISDKVHHYDGIDNYNTEIQVNLSPNINIDIAEIRLRGMGGHMTMGESGGDGYWGEWVVTDVTAAYIKIRLQMVYGNPPYGWSMDIIEHKSQTIYPVIDSIAAEAVVIGWSVPPSVAADITLIVIEYI